MKQVEPTYKQLLEKIAILENEIIQLKIEQSKHTDCANPNHKNLSFQFLKNNQGDLQFIYFDKNLSKQYEISSDEIILNSQIFKNLIDKDDFKKWMLELDNSAKKSCIINPILKIKLKSGNTQWHKITCIPNYSDNNNTLFQAIDYNITEEKQYEIKYEKIKKRYQLITDNTSDVIWIYDLTNQKFSFVSPSVFQLTGFNAEELLQKKIEESVTKESAKLLKERIPHRLNEFRNGQNTMYRDQLQIPCKDGTTIWIETISRYELSPERNIEIYGVSKDITEKLKIEEALENEKEFSENLLDTTNTLVVEIDENGNITTFNKYAEKITGYTKNEIKGKNWLEIFLPEKEKNKFPEIFKERIIDRPEYSQYENSILTKSGQELIINWSSITIYDKSGKISGTLNIGIDVSEKKETELKLKEISLIFNKFLEYSPIYIFFKDHEIRALHLSKNYEQMLGMPLEKVLGKTMDELFPSNLAKSMIADDKKILNTDQLVQVEEELNDKYYSTIKFPIKFEGKPSMLAGFTLDITDLRLSEKSLLIYKYLVEVSSDAIGISTPEGKHFYQNQAFDKLFGNIGDNPINTIYENQKIGNEVFDTIKSGSHWIGEVKLWSKEKKILNVLLRAYPIKDNNNKTIGLAGIHTDISERIKQESELKLAKEKAENSELYLLEKNKEYEALNEELRQTNEELNKAKLEIEKNHQHLMKKNKEYESLNEELRQINEELSIANAEIEKNEQKFRNYVENSPNYITIIDINGEIKYINKKQFLGNPIEGNLKNLFDYIHPDKKSEVEEQCRTVLETGQITHFINTYFFDNNEFTFENYVSRINQQNNTFLLIVSNNITDRINLEKQLRINEERLIFALIATNDGLWDWNLQTNKTYFSPQYYLMLGYQPNEFESNYQNWKDRLHPDDVNTCETAIYNHIQKNIEFNIEFRMKTKSGDWKWIQGRGKIMEKDANGKPLRMVGTHRDISDNKQYEDELKLAKENAEQREKQLRQIADNLATGMIYQIVSIDENKRKFTFLSDTVKKFYGCTFEEAKAIPNLIYDRIHPEDRQILLNAEKEATKKMTVFRCEIRLFNPDGTMRWSHFMSRPRIYKGLVYWDGLEVDVTDQKKIEQELIRAKDKAEESDRLKTAFLQNMSHEIRTPMNAIVGFTDLLNEPDLTPDKRESYTSIIASSASQLLNIVTDILTISALETKQEKLFIQPVTVNNVLIELLAIFKPQATNQNVALYLKQGLNDQQAEIQTDTTKLTQILTNLLTNAIKFTHNGFIEFGYQLVNSIQSSTYITYDNVLQFYVKDTGIGIIPDLQDKIFERFRQADLSITKKYGGTGLGLSISKGLVELLGGKIWVESEPDKGSTFYFTIPYKPLNPIFQNISSPTDEKNTITILVAEDEQYNFLYLEEQLIRMGVTILHAKNGMEAIDICKTPTHIDLILMDIKMPVLNGQEAAIEIKKIRPNIPIIAQTAYALEHERKKFTGPEFDDYIIKPIKKDELKSKIQKYINTN